MACFIKELVHFSAQNVKISFWDKVLFYKNSLWNSYFSTYLTYSIYLFLVLLGDLIRHIYAVHMGIKQQETQRRPNYRAQVVQMVKDAGNFVVGQKSKREMISNEPTTTE